MASGCCSRRRSEPSPAGHALSYSALRRRWFEMANLSIAFFMLIPPGYTQLKNHSHVSKLTQEFISLTEDPSRRWSNGCAAPQDVRPSQQCLRRACVTHSCGGLCSFEPLSWFGMSRIQAVRVRDWTQS
jgi:hypothetical protein